MPEYKVYATNAPDTELVIDETELLDLARQGLLVPGKGDINERGRIKRGRDDAAQSVNASLPSTDTSTTGA